MLGIIFIIYGINMYFTQWARVMARYREIGTMIAIGGKVKQILSMLLIENIIGTFFVAISGITLGLITTRWIQASEILNHTSFSIIFINTPVLLTPVWAIWVTLLFAVLINTAATIYPIFKAATLNPIKIIRTH